MSEFSVEILQASPAMDFELLLENSQETRIEGQVMDKLMDSWAAWMPSLTAKRIVAGKDSWLAVWLNQEVEELVDQIWDTAPSEAFLYNALAQTMCMSAIYDLLPDVAESGCAPAPKVAPALRLALEAECLRDAGNAAASALPEVPGLALNRRYAVVTYYPFRGGCEVCDLQEECPKMKSKDGSYSVVLPGHEG